MDNLELAINIIGDLDSILDSTAPEFILEAIIKNHINNVNNALILAIKNIDIATDKEHEFYDPLNMQDWAYGIHTEVDKALSIIKQGTSQ